MPGQNRPAPVKQGKCRVDEAVVAQGLAPTRTKAQALIMAGSVLLGEQPVTKPGQSIRADQVLTLKEAPHPWVSRGGLKLAHALETFGLDVSGTTALDIGASTGGFTDVLLTNGAKHIYAIDVGYGQLDWRLRQDPRVVVLEKTNARHLTPEQIPTPVNLVVCDASFISLKKVLPTPLSFTTPQATLIALIKPQFEAERHEVGKGGVIRDSALHERICGEVTTWLNGLDSWQVAGLTESPVTGPKGNKEFLVYGVRK